MLKKVLFVFIANFYVIQYLYPHDTNIIKSNPFSRNTFTFGFLMANGNIQYYQKPGKGNDELLLITTYIFPYVEYFPLNRFSTFLSLEYNYDYYKYNSNIGGMGAVIGVRYYPNSLIIKKAKRRNKNPKFTSYFGLEYGRGYWYNAPNLRSTNIKLESLGIQWGFVFHPKKILKLNMKHIVFELAGTVPVYVAKNKFSQPFGGIGIKYRFGK